MKYDNLPFQMGEISALGQMTDEVTYQVLLAVFNGEHEAHVTTDKPISKDDLISLQQQEIDVIKHDEHNYSLHWEF